MQPKKLNKTKQHKVFIYGIVLTQSGHSINTIRKKQQQIAMREWAWLIWMTDWFVGQSSAV